MQASFETVIQECKSEELRERERERDRERQRERLLGKKALITELRNERDYLRLELEGFKAKMEGAADCLCTVIAKRLFDMRLHPQKGKN